MFWNKKINSEEAIARLSKIASEQNAPVSGASRRATSLVPLAASDSIHETAVTGDVRIHQLLVSLEGNQRTGCLRISSQKHKARSAILIYRGRVVGCLYGSKKPSAHYLQQSAHEKALAVLAEPGNILDAYELPDELVLAAASLFAGDTLPLAGTATQKERFNEAVGKLSASKKPGCIVVSSADGEMLIMVYMYEGKLIGAFSAQEGWMAPTFDIAIQHIKSLPHTIVQASYMSMDAANDMDHNIGFSLTGLNNLDMPAINSQERFSLDSYGTITSEGRSYSEMQASQRHLRLPQKHSRPAIRADYIGNIFSITP